MERLTGEKLSVLESLAIRAFANYSPFGFKSLHFTSNALVNQEHNCTDSPGKINIIIKNIQSRKTEDEIFQSLNRDQACNTIPISHNLVFNLLYRIKDNSPVL
ncbi:tetratricopeptide repeat (TPR)-like superfamily protein [Artemisia annua]|uniref:Tetratricopeptide repeat (TPR)-like superfamily protein n=1 Tax=Artemisia annua TaxID=35608 RepID=A0A2U1PFS8_ARTAN|nr:tetratricopeptide repeat (TPR)-like superfamily protein [Artemisia annua]